MDRIDEEEGHSLVFKLILWKGNWEVSFSDRLLLEIFLLSTYTQSFNTTCRDFSSFLTLQAFPNPSLVFPAILMSQVFFFLSFLTSSSSHSYSRRLLLLWKICLSASNTKPTLFQIMTKGTISRCESGTQSPTLSCLLLPGTVRFGITTSSQKYLLACISWSSPQL